MKAVTICQPYPRLIMIGDKPVENRSWRTHYRGPLLIHAGKSRAWLGERDIAEAEKADDPLVFGAIVAVCTVADCLAIEDIEAGKYDEKYPQLRSRAHCYGPWCWVLTDVRRLSSPIFCNGQQGLFNFSHPSLAQQVNNMYENCEYVRLHYNVPAAIGRRITFRGRTGVIAADRGHYLGVNFDDDEPGVICNVHPTDGVEYGDMGTVRKIRKHK